MEITETGYYLSGTTYLIHVNVVSPILWVWVVGFVYSRSPPLLFITHQQNTHTQ